MNSVNYNAPRRIPAVGVAFLLSQVGAHAANCFEDRLAAVKLKPYHAGLLRMLGSNPGLSQQELSDVFGIFPSRLVVLLDQLETRSLIERRANASDRRGHRLHLTSAGRRALTRIEGLTLELERDLCTALAGPERATLTSLLNRIVAQQNIRPAVHPAYRKLLADGKRPGVELHQPSARKNQGAQNSRSKSCMPSSVDQVHRS
jgi:DNA-binding MarR family transcriptional regulator